MKLHATSELMAGNISCMVKLEVLEEDHEKKQQSFMPKLDRRLLTWGSCRERKEEKVMQQLPREQE